MGLRDRLFKKSDDDADFQNKVVRQVNYGNDVFISYSTKDKQIADKICYVLEQNALKCWIAPRNIASGRPYPSQISEAIKDSAIVVLVFSKYSMESKFVQNEINMAFSQNKPIIAFKVDETLPDGEMAFFLKTKHWIDAYPTTERSYEILVKDAFNLIKDDDSNEGSFQEPEEKLIVNNNTNQKNSRVYISYSENDGRIVGEVCDFLEDNDMSCWLRDRHQGPERIVEASVNAIKNSKALVLIFSRNSKLSNIVTAEVDFAFSYDVPILCFNVDGSNLDGNLEFFLNNKIWIDGSSNFKGELNSLLKGVLRLVPPELSHSSIIFSSSSQKVRIGDVIALSGTLNGENDVVSGAHVDIYRNGELVDTVISSISGRFSVVIPVDSLGQYDFKAIFKGNEEYEGCDSEGVIVEAVNDAALVKSSEPANRPFKAYDGEEPYIFISYKHSDTDLIIPIIKRFHDNGYNIWFDHGLQYGDDYDDLIDFKIEGSSLFVIFITETVIEGAYNPDEYMKKELDVAIDTNTKIFPIFLHEVGLKGKYRMQLRGKHSIFLHEYDDEEEFIQDCITAFMEDFDLDPVVSVDAVVEDDFEEDAKETVEEEELSEEIPIVMAPLPVYGGNEPYIFISYAHADAELVFPEIKRFNDEGYRVWYDEGIALGQEWDDEIAEALLGSSLVVVFVSENSMDSRNVHDEVILAINEGIEVLQIFLEDVKMPAGLRLRLSNKHAILKYVLDERSYLLDCTNTFKRCGISPDEGLVSKDSKANEDEYGFRYLESLFYDDESEIVLDSDIILGEAEESEYVDGILIVGDMVIDGKGHTIDARGKARLFNCNGNITIRNAILKNGFSKKSGGAIYNSGSLTIEDSSLESNASDENGGAIYNTGALTIKDSSLKANASDGYGGAICNYGYSIIYYSSLDENKAERGGAIYNNEVEVVAERMGTSEGRHDVKVHLISTVLNNNTAEQGGAIFTRQNIKHNPNPDRYDMLDAQKQHGIKLDDCKMNNNEPNDLDVKRRYTRKD